MSEKSHDLAKRMDSAESSLFSELAIRLIEGSLSDSESEDLLSILQIDRKKIAQLNDNLDAHFFLSEKFRILREKYSLKSADSELAPPNDREWKEILLWEKNAPPLVSSSMNKLLEKKTFLSKRNYQLLNSLGFAFIVLMIVWISWIKIKNEYLVPEILEEPYIAKIAETIDPVWEDENTIYRKGQRLDPDKLQLKSGMVKLIFGSGAELILEGPAEFLIKDEMHSFCKQGLVSAFIPSKAHGFEIITPFGSVVDRGTEFVLSVSEKESMVKVVQGKVDFFNSLHSTINLSVGNALKIDQNKKINTQPLSLPVFMNSENFKLHLDKWQSKQKQDRIQKEEKIDRHPNLLARYNFLDIINTTTDNCSQSGIALRQKATVRGKNISTDTPSGEKVLRLGKQSDRILLDIPESLEESTIFISFRLDTLQNIRAVLLASEKNIEKNGAITLQLLQDGRLMFRIKQDKDNENSGYFSEPFFKKNREGTWTNIALSIGKKEIAFYHEGKLISSVKRENSIPIIPDKVFLGGEKKISSVSDIPFKGAIDGFMIFNKALTTDEIGQLSN